MLGCIKELSDRIVSCLRLFMIYVIHVRVFVSQWPFAMVVRFYDVHLSV